MAISERIRKFMRNHNLKQWHIASVLGVHPNTISNWLRYDAETEKHLEPLEMALNKLTNGAASDIFRTYTNYHRIHAMNASELAEFLADVRCGEHDLCLPCEWDVYLRKEVNENAGNGV